jgi:Uma2 family endonuclease
MPVRVATASATIVESSDQEVVVMGLPLAHPLLERADFLAWEADQPAKHEYLTGEVFAMVGARQEHVLVAGALFARLRGHLRGTRCRAYMSDMKLEVLAADGVFYPDVMVSCDESDRQRPLAIQSPCLVVEVLSDATAAFDRGAKFAAYRQLPSLQEYLLVDIDRRRLELFRRESAGWVLHEPQGDPESLMLASVGLALRGADAFGDLVE